MIKKFDVLVQVIRNFSTPYLSWEKITEEWRVVEESQVVKGPNGEWLLPNFWKVDFDPFNVDGKLYDIFKHANKTASGWTCCCSHNQLHDLYLIQNMVTKKKVVVGNICIRHFESSSMTSSALNLQSQTRRLKGGGLQRIDKWLRFSTCKPTLSKEHIKS